MGLTNATDEDFERLVKAVDGPVVVDFWAPWCGPCKLFSPIFEQVSNELKSLTFFKVNTDEAQQVSKSRNVRSVPTVMVLRKGVEVERFCGVFSKEQLIRKLSKFV